MFWRIKQVLIVIIEWILSSKICVFSNEPCIARPTLIDLNSIKLNYYPFMISLDDRTGSYKVIDDLSSKICLHSKIKDINVKVFNMITRTNDANF